MSNRIHWLETLGMMIVTTIGLAAGFAIEAQTHNFWLAITPALLAALLIRYIDLRTE